MGQEIDQRRFTDDDFARFRERLAVETRLVVERIEAFSGDRVPYRIGCELESCLVDPRSGGPAPDNERLIAALDDPMVVPELSRFDFELNASPALLAGDGFAQLQADLHARWLRCAGAASSLDRRAAMIGILPTLREGDLTLANMSHGNRYAALNDQVMALRGGRPIHIDLDGVERLELDHGDVMLESAATSFQVHLEVDPRDAARFYNASKIASALTVGCGANSPFLFGRNLWAETRIPLFEQSVDVGAPESGQRVSFGIDYARDSITECFTGNLHRYPVLLPLVAADHPPTDLAHLRLHNGTIWRWNRPLVSLTDDAVSVRIEHRVLPAGPTVLDAMANAAFYVGLAIALAESADPPEQRLDFSAADTNFYSAAREGLAARVRWLDGRVSRTRLGTRAV